METCGDFVKWLGADMSFKILMHLDDPSDLARFCAVSRSWRQFVITNNISKQLCLKIVPEVASVAQFIERDKMIEPVKVRQSDCFEWERLRRNHRVYAMLARGLNPVLEKKCISKAISATSTDHNPQESIQNTLEPSDRVENGASYWSSTGKSDPSVPERLIYKLISNLCIITEVHIHPFQAYFQDGFPIYSAKSVRFRLGYPKVPLELENDAMLLSAVGHMSLDDDIVWTYTSPEYPMAQENCLQQFKLPEPVLSIGGILQVELLGRVQRQEMNGLFYICISHVQAIGHPLLLPFDVEIDPTGKCMLKHCPESQHTEASNVSQESKGTSIYSWPSMTVRLVWENVILSALRGSLPVEDNGSEDEHLP